MSRAGSGRLRESRRNAILVARKAVGDCMLLKGNVAVVSGGGRGIGRAIAKRFAAEGAAVLIASRSEAELGSVVREIEEARGRAAFVTADVSREADCVHIVAVAQERLGPIGILVNNTRG